MCVNGGCDITLDATSLLTGAFGTAFGFTLSWLKDKLTNRPNMYVKVSTAAVYYGKDTKVLNVMGDAFPAVKIGETLCEPAEPEACLCVVLELAFQNRSGALGRVQPYGVQNPAWSA